MSETIEPFRLAIPDDALADLRRRLADARFPDAETVPGWTQGVPLAEMRSLRDHWQYRYNWRRCEAWLNAVGQFRTAIDGCGIHFLHVRSPEPGALPLVLTHGWPGSVIEFAQVIGPLTDPRAHGRDPKDAFHVVIPSLPGYGFSDKPTEAGWTTQRVARAWTTLMARLGYDRFVAQGGDWGSSVTHALGVQAPDGLLGIHLNMAIAIPDASEREDLTDDEEVRLAEIARHSQQGRGYSEQQRTRPQTIGYALADSPVGQAAWIYEKFREWSDCDGDPLNSFRLDHILDNIMLYWLTDSGASSARLYWQSIDSFSEGTPTVPVGLSIFPKEIFRPSRRWVERRYPTLSYWNEPARGGHFAAFEAPEIFVDEVGACFRPLRDALS